MTTTAAMDGPNKRYIKPPSPKNGSSEVPGTPWNQWITGSQPADNLFLHSLYCKRATILAIVENTLLLPFFANPDAQLRKNPAFEGQEISHWANVFHF
jgi:hypothetical protein